MVSSSIRKRLLDEILVASKKKEKKHKKHKHKENKKQAPALPVAPKAPPKMVEMAKQSVQGNLSSFAGVFNMSELTVNEKADLKMILEKFSSGKEDLNGDLSILINITSEVKAINNQAIILHGERLKRAQALFHKYQEGAFSAWLLATYGNRQTPYNFIQYYTFYETLPQALRPKLEVMPRQAIYTLASREGPFPLKQKIIESYEGETKTVLLEKIRETFPLDSDDKRKSNTGDAIILALTRANSLLNRKKLPLTENQKEVLKCLLEEIHSKLSRLEVL